LGRDGLEIRSFYGRYGRYNDRERGSALAVAEDKADSVTYFDDLTPEPR